jgi:hypothetical protein
MVIRVQGREIEKKIIEKRKEEGNEEKGKNPNTINFI